MRGLMDRLLAVGLLAVLLGTASCASTDLDDDDAADVVMQILTMNSPAVTAQRQSTTSGTCSGVGTLCQSNSDCPINEVCVRTDLCTLEVTDWSVTIQAAPKNSLAGTPFNDIVMIDVTITYSWVNPGIVTPQFVVGLGNVTIPAAGTNQISFPPISSDAINTNPLIEGATANLTMVFRGRTVEGTEIRQTATRQLIVEICT